MVWEFGKPSDWFGIQSATGCCLMWAMGDKCASSWIDGVVMCR